ncbi:MAG: antibiotic biosynthesis monooxygenase family protein [Syntrophales bacterium]|jgi:heme oxygenase (mycobilin-producing)
MIRVVIERYCKPGKEAQLRDLLKELRMAAMNQYGYISGETLCELDNPSLFIVISTWAALDAWRAWEVSQRRLLIEERIDSLITGEKNLRILAFVYES